MKTSSGHIDYVLVAIVSTIIFYGLIMLLSASAPSGYATFQDSYYFVKHQVIFGLIPGIGALIAFSRIPYTFWRKHAWNLLMISIALLVLVFIPGLSAGIGTAKSWISIGGVFSLQPSEIVKLTFLFYLAAWLAQRSGHGVRDVKQGLVPFLLVLGGMMILMILQPDIGTMSIIAAMSLVVYFAAGAPISHVIGIVTAGLASLGLLIAAAPYRAARFTAFLNPDFDPQGIGYHVSQALLAVGSGGFFGVGYGHSRQKFQYLPEVSGDSIFAVIAEELGFIFAAFTIIIFLLLLWRMILVAKNAPDDFSKFVVIGIAAWLIIQAFVNIGSMVAIMPITGVPLPFVSYGGTALAISMGAIGVVLNISRFVKT